MRTDRKQVIRLTWKRFRGSIRTLVESKQGPKAMLFAGTLVLLMLVINGLNVVNSYVGRDFMSSIENKNPGMFTSMALLYAVVFIVSTVVAVFYRFTEERLGILWREQLTWRLTESYLSRRTYYRLDSAAGIANPDQRITDDVRAFTTTTLSFMLLILNGTITAVLFSGVLWSISPFLFVVAVVYAVCGTAITLILGKPLIRLNYNQLDMEANFRADLIHVRENSESIALSHREGRFTTRLKSRLDALTSNFRRLIRINRNLGFFTNGYNYFIQIIPALIIAPKFIYGEIEFGVITQSTMAFATLLGAFSLIVTQFQQISAFTAVTARLHFLSEAIERAHEKQPCAIEAEEAPDRIRYQDVTLRSEDGTRLLVEKLTLEIPQGARWLISGPEDSARVALFRATAGIWDCGEGKILRPGLEEVLFLPERPYLPPGTLRDVLLRTSLDAVTKDPEVHSVLRRLGLQEVVSRAGGLDANKDWDDVFSIGEQHLLSFARILLARPAFVLLDRPGSSLPKPQVAIILEMLAEQGIGVVVFAKNDEISLNYDHIVEIRADGSWEVHKQAGAAHQHPDAHPDDLSC
jgi:vitamin B12/bleomycin/antimicrobial peptide transport system ATP-binding/permease protein